MKAEHKSSQIPLDFVEADVSIEPLSRDTLKDAIALANAVFPESSALPENPAVQYAATIEPDIYRPAMERIGVRTQQHWVVKKRGRGVIGLTGLQNMLADPAEIAWLGWVCIDPETRGRKLGRKTLEWTIDRARHDGCAILRLDTTDLPSQRRAQGLYDALGFVETKRYKRSRDTYTVIIREKVL